MGAPTRRNASAERDAASNAAIAARLERMREAVRDVPDPDRGPVTAAVVKKLRDAELSELADIAQHYVPSNSRSA
jgi:hypothetical protein